MPGYWEGIKGRVTQKIKIQNEKFKVAIQISKSLSLLSVNIEFFINFNTLSLILSRKGRGAPLFPP
jgi:hypothetical protein